MTKMRIGQSWTALLVFACLGACGVDSQTGSTGGLRAGDSPRDLQGFAVLSSDFTSTNVTLLSAQGEVRSASFLSSASGDPGLSAALGGDVVLPSTPSQGDELLLIDRFPTSVLTWVSLETGEVRAQLSVATGFASNPHDYVAYSPTQAFVTRFEPNLMSGALPFDGGADVLVIDPATGQIEDRIDLSPAFAGAPDGIYPRADRAVLAAGQLRVLALGSNLDFTAQVASRLISIDPETRTIEHVLVLDMMKGCGSPALAPQGSELAIACTGTFGPAPAEGYTDSGIVLVSLTDPPVATARWTAAELGIDQVNRVAWVDEDHLALLTSGRLDPETFAAEADDRALTLDARAGTLSPPWLTGAPFSLGDVVCSPQDGVCLVADADTDGGVVHRLAIGTDGTPIVSGTLEPDPVSGLPPRSFGIY